MNETFKTVLISALVAAIVTIVGVSLVGGNDQSGYGTTADTYFRMPNSNAQFKTITSAGAYTGTTGAFSSTLYGVGNMAVGSTTVSIAKLLVESSSATSSVVVSSGAGANKGGRIILEDSDGAGCSEIYILNGTVISGSITCPTGI
jgi:hypothetical protein